MDIFVTSPKGVPQESLVSIRYGGTRRQVHLEQCPGPLRFPLKQGIAYEALKVDILLPIASARLAVHPREGQYHLSFPDQEDMSIHLSCQPQGDNCNEGRTGQTKQESSAMAADARDYLEGHGLLIYVQALLNAIIQARPQDPYAFMWQQLGACMSNRQAEVPRKPAEAVRAEPPAPTEQLPALFEEEVPQKPAEPLLVEPPVPTEQLAALSEEEVPQKPAEALPIEPPVPMEQLAVLSEEEVLQKPAEALPAQPPLPTEQLEALSEKEVPQKPAEALPVELHLPIEQLAALSEEEVPQKPAEVLPAEPPLRTEQSEALSEEEVPQKPAEALPAESPLPTEQLAAPSEDEVPQKPAEVYEDAPQKPAEVLLAEPPATAFVEEHEEDEENPPIERNKNGCEEPHSARPKLYNINGTEVDWNATYKIGGQLWYLQCRLKEAVKAGSPIAGYRMKKRCHSVCSHSSEDEKADSHLREEAQEASSSFQQIDANGDGVISKNEIEQWQSKSHTEQAHRECIEVEQVGEHCLQRRYAITEMRHHLNDDEELLIRLKLMASLVDASESGMLVKKLNELAKDRVSDAELASLVVLSVFKKVSQITIDDIAEG
eukprot:TRINITY_DN12313_c0_g1_i1.p1 TRINITY_DN12313_c0_g1~~TRINITY_DN12313_c0_g1_i1.p1  ORF type:complete len:620 (-),score=158.00 TRINITY_DN12313_c0_g1_i1:98-1909(-)